MSVKALVVALALGVIAWPQAAGAEKVKSNQSTVLYSRAGEHSPVVLKVKPGQSMTVLAKDGRWLKVRVSGRTGWVPRTKVAMPEADEDISRNTRRRPFVDGRGTKRGFGGEAGPDDRVGADAMGDGADGRPGKPDKAARPTRGDSRSDSRSDDDDGDAKPRGRKPAKAAPRAGKPSSRESPRESPRESRDVDDDGDRSSRDRDSKDDSAVADDAAEARRPMAHVAKSTSILNEPSKDSEESFKAGPKTALYVVEEKGKWTFVENDEGDAGYVLTSRLDVDPPAGGAHARVIDVRGRLGVTLISQSVSTPGAPKSLPDNYTASSSSLTLALGGSVLYPTAKRYWIGGELAYDFDKAIPGISYMNQSISFSYHVLNLRAIGGYDLQKENGMTVFGRLGFHYDSFQVSDFDNPMKNTAKLPNQIISAPTIGAALAIPLLTKEIGLTVSLDTILFGASVQQTKNLEDGTGPSAKAVFLGGRLTYRWKPKMDLQATYDLTYTSLSFSGMAPSTSIRGHTGTTPSSGSDFNNAVSAGIAYAF